MKSFIELFLENINSDVKGYVKSAENIDISRNLFDINALNLYYDMIRKIKNYKYEKSVELIDKIVKDPKLKFILSLGYGGKFSDLALKISVTQIPAIKLIPTQSEIDITNSMKYTLQGKDIGVCFYDPVVIIRPIVTFNSKYIVDGHHRWSQIYLTNPDANLACLNIDGQLSPLDLLKAVQSTIGTNLGYLESRKVKGTSIFDANTRTIRDYIKKSISQKCIEEFRKQGIQDPVQHLLDSSSLMKVKNKPIKNAPERGYMPQTSHDPQLFTDLKTGVADYRKI